MVPVTPDYDVRQADARRFSAMWPRNRVQIPRSAGVRIYQGHAITAVNQREPKPPLLEPTCRLLQRRSIAQTFGFVYRDHLHPCNS
jgi:hypothetical protein